MGTSEEIYFCYVGVLTDCLFSLLDVGPTAEGEIIAPMANNLLDAGAWLRYSGDCVYATVCFLFHFLFQFLSENPFSLTCIIRGSRGLYEL